MQQVRVDKASLREKVQANRDEHRSVYDDAMNGYKKAAISFFERQLDRAREGKRFQQAFVEPMPDDHTDDYDTVLGMLDMSEDETVVLSFIEYRQYVEDQWGWKQHFTAVTSNYTGN